MNAKAAFQRNEKHRSLYAGSAVIISAAILLSEHHLPATVIDSFAIDSQITALEGSMLHQICYLVLGACGIYCYLKHRIHTYVPNSPVALSFLFLWLWCLLSIYWADDPALSARRVASMSLVLTAALGAGAAWSRKEVVGFIALSGAAHLSVGLLGEIVTGNFTPLRSGYRFAGTLFWNQQGLCCSILALSALVGSDLFPRKRTYFLFLSAYGLMFLLLTRSRSSLLALSVGLLVYIAFVAKARLKVGFTLGGIVLCISLYMMGAVDAIAAILTRGGEGSENLTGRLPVWDECFQFIHVHPLIGYGFEDFWTPDRIYYFSHRFFWSISAAHSGYIETLLTIGEIGLGLQTIFLLLSFSRGLSLYKETNNVMFVLSSCFCVIYLVAGTLEAVLVVKLSPYSFYLFVLMASLCTGEGQDGTLVSVNASVA